MKTQRALVSRHEESLEKEEKEYKVLLPLTIKILEQK